MTVKVNRAAVQIVAALAILVLAFVIAYNGSWVFADHLTVTKDDPTLSQLVLSDRATVGFIRFALVLLALYAIVSVPALIVGGRWLKGFNSTGLTADDPVVADSADAIKDLQTKVEQLQQERDAAKQLAQRALEV